MNEFQHPEWYSPREGRVILTDGREAPIDAYLNQYGEECERDSPDVVTLRVGPIVGGMGGPTFCVSKIEYLRLLGAC